jgi:hypothetical protein
MANCVPERFVLASIESFGRLYCTSKNINTRELPSVDWRDCRVVDCASLLELVALPGCREIHVRRDLAAGVADVINGGRDVVAGGTMESCSGGPALLR